jgi:metal-responsive CopG/Arc/MetJ family transcriptional regulator
MPRLSTKITVKLEPELLQELQVISESEGQTISRLVREAVNNYVNERREEDGMGILRLSMSRFEMSVVADLVRIGYADTAEHVFHEAFHDQMATHGIGKTLEMASRIRELSPIKGVSPATPVSLSFAPKRRHPEVSDDDEEEEESVAPTQSQKR